jgi:hypothetical protein
MSFGRAVVEEVAAAAESMKFGPLDKGLVLKPLMPALPPPPTATLGKRCPCPAGDAGGLVLMPGLLSMASADKSRVIFTTPEPESIEEAGDIGWSGPSLPFMVSFLSTIGEYRRRELDRSPRRNFLMIAVMPMRAPFFPRHRDLALSAGSDIMGAEELAVDSFPVS